MCNWLKSLFGKKCHCEGGCCGDKNIEKTPEISTKEEVVREVVAPEEIKA